MVIMTNKQFEERLEEERKRIAENYYQEQRLESMRDRIFRMENEIAKLKGDNKYECCEANATPHGSVAL